MSEQQTAERRHYLRHPLNFPLEYKVLEKGSPGQLKGVRSSTLNISHAGLMFSAKQPVDIKTVIRIKMPVQSKVFNIKAEVAHCDKDEETGLYNIGVSFRRFSDAFKTKLVEQIYLIIEYRDIRSLQLGRDMSLEEASREWIKRYSERFKKLYW
ncbi:MAG: PilZ domain-containing protein [Candidatus Omnitrophota bacterium]|nr:PilZ domain-containing protein [Candidatus Omnitrophota bacterium]